MMHVMYIYNVKNPKRGHRVLIQSNKNFGVCDVIFSNKPKKPTRPHFSNKEAIASYKEAMITYRENLSEYLNKRSQFLNIFKGRQFNDLHVQEEIDDVLTIILNKV